MKKSTRVVGVCLVMLGVYSLIHADLTTGKIIELKFAQPFSPKHTMQAKVFEPWAEKINKLTNGKVKVTFFPGGALGKTPDHYDLAEKGIGF